MLGIRGLLLHPRHGLATRTGGQAQAALALPQFSGSRTGEVSWVSSQQRSHGSGRAQRWILLCASEAPWPVFDSSLLEHHGNALAGD